jgi:hypothetical protein
LIWKAIESSPHYHLRRCDALRCVKRYSDRLSQPFGRHRRRCTQQQLAQPTTAHPLAAAIDCALYFSWPLARRRTVVVHPKHPSIHPSIHPYIHTSIPYIHTSTRPIRQTPRQHCHTSLHRPLSPSIALHPLSLPNPPSLPTTSSCPRPAPSLTSDREESKGDHASATRTTPRLHYVQPAEARRESSSVSLGLTPSRLAWLPPSASLLTHLRTRLLGLLICLLIYGQRLRPGQR